MEMVGIETVKIMRRALIDDEFWNLEARWTRCDPHQWSPGPRRSDLRHSMSDPEKRNWEEYSENYSIG